MTGYFITMHKVVFLSFYSIWHNNIASNSHDVEWLKLALSQYDHFYNGLTQQDNSEWLLFLMYNVSMEPVPCSYTDNCTSTSLEMSKCDFLSFCKKSIYLL